MTVGPEMLTLRETALRLGVKADHVTRLVERGDLDAVDVSIGRRKRCLRVSAGSVERFLNARRVTPQPAQPSRPRSSLPPGVWRICG